MCKLYLQNIIICTGRGSQWVISSLVIPFIQHRHPDLPVWQSILCLNALCIVMRDLSSKCSFCSEFSSSSPSSCRIYGHMRADGHQWIVEPSLPQNTRPVTLKYPTQMQLFLPTRRLPTCSPLWTPLQMNSAWNSTPVLTIHDSNSHLTARSRIREWERETERKVGAFGPSGLISTPVPQATAHYHYVHAMTDMVWQFYFI